MVSPVLVLPVRGSIDNKHTLHRAAETPGTNAKILPDVESRKKTWFEAIERMRIAGRNVSDVREAIECGVVLKPVTDPPIRKYSNTKALLHHVPFAETRLLEYIAIGAVEELREEPAIVQPLHIVVKSDRKPRLVLDLSRNFNQYLEGTYVKYEDLQEAIRQSTPGCWYGKHDLSDCYLSFPVETASRRFLSFCLSGRYYRFTRLPFGLSTAPRVCTELLDVVSGVMRERGIKHVRYLDDFLYIGSTPSEVAANMLSAEQILFDFGLRVNGKKTVDATQRIVFLGIELDSLSCSIACSRERIDELINLIDQTLGQSKITMSQLRTLVGKFSFAAQVLQGARAFMRRLRGELDNLSKPHFRVRFTTPMKEDLRFWRGYINVWNGRRLWVNTEPVLVVSSDASLNGFGGLVEFDREERLSGQAWSGSWSTKHSHQTNDSGRMVWMELYAALFAITKIAKSVSNCAVKLILDNATDVSILNRWSARSSDLSTLLREIAKIAADKNISLVAEHRSGVDNVWPDLLSRPELHCFRSLEKLRLTVPVVLSGAVTSLEWVNSGQIRQSLPSAADCAF
jgi:Reverse transcriptase (RNA-dependent DNA polymerase)